MEEEQSKLSRKVVAKDCVYNYAVFFVVTFKALSSKLTSLILICTY